jgi:AraC-like DNA-binding protein
VDYGEFRPPDALREIVSCTWQRTVAADEEPPSARVLPDGCVDLVWRRDQLLVAGPDRDAWMSELRPGETVVGLRLRPGLGGPALGMPASELRNARVDVADLWGPRGAELAGRVGDAESPDARRRALTEAVLARMAEVETPDPIVSAAVSRLGLPGSRVGLLGEALGIGERQLLRRFDAAVGYGPKLLDRILRFQRFVARAPAIAGGEEELARVAAELGYADQPHLSRDCKALSGLSPAQLVTSRPAFEAR